ncbi:MAG: hypothetical protein HRU34_14905 [Richelia sp.]|nr:hypothetical protein [Richelia sp.]CDN09795.1 hypothetical protein RintRC_1306 [Richelia intracellularis]
MGFAESGDDFTKFSRIFQWFQTLIHPAFMQCQILYDLLIHVEALTHW